MASNRLSSMSFATILVWLALTGVLGARSQLNQSKVKKAVPYRLNFPALYPDITSKPGSGCRHAWDALSAVKCHDKVFDRISDNGTFRPLSWDPMYFLPKLCTPECDYALRRAAETLSENCSPDDVFVSEGYDGMFSLALLEPGPSEAISTILRRKKHLCRKSRGNDSDFKYCPVEMAERFAVADGINPNLNGIEAFIRDTDNRRIEPSRRFRGRRGSGTHSYNYDILLREQRYGPGDGDTSCGWCVFDYLERTLNSWSEGSVLNPETQEPITLPEFIRWVKKAGKRCAPEEKWDRIYQKAIENYQSSGLLPMHWEQALPSGDLNYLIRNGVAEGDSPLKEILTELRRLPSEQAADNWEGSSKACLQALANRYKAATCYINLSQEKLTDMLREEERGLRSVYCSQACSDSVNTESISTCNTVHTTPKVRQFLDDFYNAKIQRDTYCNLVEQGTSSTDCAQALLNMGQTQWAFSGRPKTSELLATVIHELDSLKAKSVPDEVRLALKDGTEALASSKARRVYQQWKKDLGAGICAHCIWNWLATPSMAKTMLYMKEATSSSDYVATVKEFHATCTSLGADWLGGVPHGNDPVLWRVKDERGKVMRYFESPKLTFKGIEVHGVDETNGRVVVYEEKRGRRPGLDVGSLWHVLQAERGLIASEEGRFDEWKQREDKKREEMDAKIWNVNWAGVEYIGPQGQLRADKEGGRDEL